MAAFRFIYFLNWLFDCIFLFFFFFVFLFACWHRCWVHFILWPVHSFASLWKSFDLWLELPLINNLCLFLRWMRPAESILRPFFFSPHSQFILYRFCVSFWKFFCNEWLVDAAGECKGKNDIGQLNCLHVSFFTSFCECCSIDILLVLRCLTEWPPFTQH